MNENKHPDDELDGEEYKSRFRSATEEDLANAPSVIFVFGQRPKPPEEVTDDGDLGALS